MALCRCVRPHAGVWKVCRRLAVLKVKLMYRTALLCCCGICQLTASQHETLLPPPYLISPGVVSLAQGRQFFFPLHCLQMYLPKFCLEYLHCRCCSPQKTTCISQVRGHKYEINDWLTAPQRWAYVLSQNITLAKQCLTKFINAPLFWCCDRSFWHVTTVFVGRWVILTAESVVFTDWPPAPLAL